MADIAEIGIGIDSSQITTAKQELQRLGTAFNSAERSASVFVQSFDRAFKTAQKDIQYLRDSARAFQDLVNKANNVTNAYKSAEESASVFATELQRSEQFMRNQSKAFGELVTQVNTYKTANKSASDSAEVFIKVLREQELQALKTARANQQSINAQLGVSGPRATEGGAGFGAMEAEIERLALKYNKIYASSKLYESSLEELNRAHRFGVISTQQHESAVEQLNLEYQQFAAGTTKVSNRFVQYDQSLVTSMKSTNRFGMVAQQVGYQVGDFFVQVQSGTNAFVAFGQQATQLAGLLPGVAGAVAGIGISITTALLAFWSRSSDAAEAANKVKDAFAELREETEATALEIERINRGLISTGETTAVIAQEDLQRQLNDLRAQRAMADVESSTFLELQISALEEQIAANQEIIDGYRKKAEQLETAEERQKEIEESQNRLNRSLITAYTLYGNLRTQGEAWETQQERFNQRLMDAYRLYGNLRTQGDELARKEQEEVVTQQERFNQRLMDAYRLYANLRLQARGLATDTSEALRLAQQELSARGKISSGRGGDPRTSNLLGRGRFVYTGPSLDEFNNPIITDRQSGALQRQIGIVQELTEAERQRKQVIESIESSLESGLMALIDGTKSVKDAFKLMARDIIAELYRVFVVQRIVGAVSGAATLATSGLGFFRSSGGSVMPGQSYIVGEKGPEIIRPRHSGTVVPAHLSGTGGQASMTVNNNITVTGSDAANVRMEVAKMIPQITEATKAAVIDARRRGGQMKAAFG